jgi:hypothetical protein
MRLTRFTRNKTCNWKPAEEQAHAETRTSQHGARSTARKESETKYPDRPMPAQEQTEGAFGKEDERRWRIR